MTLREALTRATTQLDQNPDLRADALRDAALLLRHALSISHASLLANPERIITLDEQAAYQILIFRRLTNEPIQYITGGQEFYGLVLEVNKSVLIPRPETEVLVEAVLGELGSTEQGMFLLDVGTGSGAIAVALARHLPRAHIFAIDVSAEALEVAAANAARNDLSDRIHIMQSDLLDGVVIEEGGIDAIVSNPPYVPLAERETLHPQVRDHEPALALYAGEDGLDVYRRLIPQAMARLNPKGLLALEIGHGQRDGIAALLADWSDVRFVDDLQGIPRVAIARRPRVAAKTVYAEWTCPPAKRHRGPDLRRSSGSAKRPPPPSELSSPHRSAGCSTPST